MNPFARKLLLFFAPLLAIFSAPALVLVASSEWLSADEIAKLHFEGPRDAVYGPAYTNPDARYKLVGALLRRPKLLAMGSSRALEYRSDLFTLPDGAFYNVGLLTERLFEFRRAFRQLPLDDCKGIILVLDQWNFNPNWPNVVDNPLYEREISAGDSNVLNALQRSVWSVWHDLASGHLELTAVLAGGHNLGVNARVRGNGFRWDGSYYYADVLADPVHAKDYQFKNSLGRVASGSNRYEFATDVDPRALDELRLLLAEARRRGLNVVAYLPPYAPTVEHALRNGGRHTYMAKIAAAVAPVFEEAGYPFFDFTSCESLGCTDAEFVDGVHAGTKADARILLELVKAAPWLKAWVDVDVVTARIAASAPGTELAPGEKR